jgi:hypothetical protein
MGGRRDGKDVLHTGGGEEESYTLYDNVRGHGWLVAEPDVRGLHFENLGPHDVVHSIATYGNMVFKECGAATILIDSHYEGTMHVKGENSNRNGITAFQFALLEICNPCIWVEDNNSLVMTDFYNEQSISIYRLEGNENLPSGRISLGSIKVENPARTVDGYHGQLTLLYPQYYNNNLNGVAVWKTQNGASVDYLEVAPFYYHHSLEWPDDGSFRARFLATGGSQAKTETKEHFFATHADASVDEIRAQLQATLEDFRRVGLLDLQFNHPNLKF